MTNLAAVYGVNVSRATGVPAWKAISVRRLSGAENGSKHHVFVKVLKANGDRDRDPSLRIGWTWEGKGPSEPAPPVPLDKPDRGELGHGNVPINPRQKIGVWIIGGAPFSDLVSGMHTGFPDEAPGNTWGHFSYEVIFQRMDEVPPVGPTKPTDNVTKAEFWTAINAMQKDLDELKALLRRWDGE